MATAPPLTTAAPLPEDTPICWIEDGEPRAARWYSERGAPPPARVHLADDTLDADTAYHLACEGTALLWRGDFHNARQLLDAMSRRVERRPRRKSRGDTVHAGAASTPAAAFHRHRQLQAQRARVLSQLLIPLSDDYTIELRRAPDHRLACEHAWGSSKGGPQVVALRELLGIVGAFEWYKKGVPIAALGPPPGNRIHACYGVFSPLRGEYIDLVAQAPLPAAGSTLAFDIATGTGVLACVLARRGVQRIVATERDPRALACASENVDRLGFSERIRIVAAELFPPAPEGRAGLILCNPPWLPARASSPIEHAVYDEDSRMLRAYLAGLSAHLAEAGEGWLILSDLAEHLGLRTREALLGWIEAAGLRVLGRLDTRPRHPKATDADDPLHAARAAEITSLWRLGART